ncbi:MAG: FAD:protein FMN transferase [Eubacteriales bacterium]|nr:FAD:protein FMN transferase [Eubacteriales bacterium]
MKQKWIAGVGVFAVVSLGILTASGFQNEKDEKPRNEKEIQMYSDTDFAMDTVVMETLYTTGEDKNPLVGETLREVEQTLLSWTNENSQISRLNRAGGASTEVSSELLGYLEMILQLAEDSKGAFDPTLGEIIRLWDISGENPKVPGQEEVETLLQTSGYEKIRLEGKQVTLEEGCTLDLGAIGKGIGCDVIAEELQKQEEITGMILNLGGSSVMAYGQKPDQSQWKVALTDPRDVEGGYLGAIALKGGEFLATSGDYEKYFMEGGKRYHHILDPQTGYPVWNGLTSVTVVCDSGLLADGLSTACFVLGMEDALELLEKYNADGAFADEEHNIYLTAGMEERFELLKNTYTTKLLN